MFTVNQLGNFEPLDVSHKTRAEFRFLWDVIKGYIDKCLLTPLIPLDTSKSPKRGTGHSHGHSHFVDSSEVEQ